MGTDELQKAQLLRNTAQEEAKNKSFEDSSDPESILSPFLFFSSILLVVLTLCVIGLAPVSKAVNIENWTADHQRLKNFIVAEKMVSPLAPASPRIWYIPIKPRSREIGSGIWYAEGIVVINPGTEVETHLFWRAMFLLKTLHPLYLSIGSVEEGDFNGTLRLAGLRQEDLSR